MNGAYPIDYDPYRLADFKPSCAMLDTGRKKGSGFVISSSELLTCNHVMGATNAATCTFEGREETFDVSRRDSDADLCVLKSRGTAAWPPLKIANPTPCFRSWWAWGFPATFDGQGVPLFGMLADPSYLYEGRRMFQLYAENLVGDDVELGGLSGSPVLTGKEVVGVIYRVLVGHGDLQRARMGIIYAVPITAGGFASAAVSPGTPLPPLPPPDPTPSPDEWKQIELFEALSTASSAAAVLSIVDEWKRREDVTMPSRVPLIAAERLLGMGKPKPAMDLLSGELSQRALELKALGLSLTGEHDKARAILVKLPPSAETGGIGAGVLKRQYMETGNRAWLQSAFDQYEVTFQRTKDHYPGINAAATALWLGKRDLSRKLARDVLDVLDEKPKANWAQWEWASFGEASLLVGRAGDAIAGYEKAVAGEPAMSRNIAVMRKQARITLPLLEVPAGEFEQILGIGGVAVFSGHRVDEEGRNPPRFPQASVAAVAARIGKELDARKIRYGFSSAAGGADILFLEQLLKRGGEPTVYLPFPAEQFIETSVGPGWRKRFEAVMAKLGKRCHVLLDRKPVDRDGEDAAYASCNEAIVEAALDAARIYDEKPVFIAVLSAPQGDAKVLTGGTADALRSWDEQGLGDSVVIDPRQPVE